jgi:SAM-dependent methyltransferase
MRCLLCERSAAAPGPYGIPPRLGKCPHCGSKPQHRELAFFVRKHLKDNLKEGAKVLEVGPAPAQLAHFARPEFIGPARYTAVDVRRPAQDLAGARFLEMDVTRLTFSDQSFELILCNHVLSFIRSDFQAMSQIHRCLKSDGVALMNADIHLTKTRKFSEAAQEDPVLFTEDFRIENGTEWVYGEDYFERLEAAGFFHRRLPVRSFAAPAEIQEHGFRADGGLILCFKFRDSMERCLGGL